MASSGIVELDWSVLIRSHSTQAAHSARMPNKNPTSPPSAPGARERIYNLLLSGSVLDPDGSAYEAEGRADLVFQKSLIGKVELYGAVGEEHECRGGDRCLRHIENLDALAHGDRGAFEVDALEEAVHLRGGHTLAALPGNFFEHRQDSLGAFAAAGGNEDDRRVVQEF